MATHNEEKSDIRQPSPGAKDVIVRFDWYDLLGAGQVVSAATFMEE